VPDSEPGLIWLSACCSLFDRILILSASSQPVIVAALTPASRAHRLRDNPSTV
jgi:hypothetical protein